MKNYLEEISIKLKNQIEIEELIIIDNSHKHKGHKFYSNEKFYLHLKIKSIYLSPLSRVIAQKLIMKVLKKDLEKTIHALEISIEQ